MEVLIISTNTNRLPMPVMPYGACIVAEAAERAGHGVKLLDLMFEHNSLLAVESALLHHTYDVIGLSIRNIDNNDIQHPAFFLKDLRPIVRTIRAFSDAPIVLGGAALGVMPEEILKYSGASYAIIGEGDRTFIILLKAISSSNPPYRIPGVAWIEDGVYRHIPRVPGSCSGTCIVPDYHHWIDVKAYASGMATVPVQTKLGCHFRCVYCTYQKIEGSGYRLASPESVSDAIGRLEADGFRNIEFVDNVFNSPHDHALDICDRLARMRHRTRLQSIELNTLHFDHELMNAMEHAGFVGIGITAESASGQVLKGLGKGFSEETVYQAARVVKNCKFPCLWIFLIGGPGETKRTVEETLRFASTQIRRGDTIFFNAGIRIYPGTELEAIARTEGVLTIPRDDMLEPVFYFSPEIELEWVDRRLREFIDTHLNVVNSDAISLPLLIKINRFAGRLGVQPPLWRHTRPIRRILRYTGVYR